MVKYFKTPAGQTYESWDGARHKAEDVPMTKKDYDAGQKAQALESLRKMLKPGCTVHTILNHRSASGMSRSISLVYADKKDGVVKLDYLVALVTGYSFDNKHGGLKVSGCGMDMGFALVYELGAALWPKGTKKPHGTRNGEPDSAGGYALKQQWL